MSLVFEPFADIDPVDTFALALHRPVPLLRDTGEQFALAQHRPTLTLGLAITDTFALTYPRLTPVFIDDGDVFALAQHLPRAYLSAFVPPELNVAYLEQHRPIFSGTGTVGVMDTFALPILRLKPNFRDAGEQFILPQYRPGVYANDFFADGALFIGYQSPGYISMLSPEDATHKFLFDIVGFSADSPAAQAVLELLDSIAFHGDVAQQVHLHALIAAQLAFGDLSFGAPAGILSDTVHFSDSNVALAMYLATLLDSFSVAAELTKSAAIFAFLSDTFTFNAALSVQQQIMQALQDGIEFGITLFTGADTYTAWVMTTESRAMRHYSNYAFNSYGHFGGRLYGAKDDGVYVLEGDTDAGQPINASVRTGLLDFGSRQLKRVHRAYLGYTADGTLALRVTTTSPQGKKVDYTYRMVKTPDAEAPRETRVIIGQGLQSVYWAFELDNSLDGGDFELHDVTVLPIILSRKVR